MRVRASTGLVTLCLTMRGLLAYEQEIGAPLGASKGSPRVIRALLYAMTREYHSSITVEQAGELWPLDELPMVMERLIRTIKNSLPVTDATKDPEPSPVSANTLSDWESLWAIGRVNLHLAEEEFWSLTPGMFYALCKRVTVPQEKKPLSEEDEIAIVLQKVEALNTAMGGIDLRKSKS